MAKAFDPAWRAARHNPRAAAPLLFLLSDPLRGLPPERADALALPGLVLIERTFGAPPRASASDAPRLTTADARAARRAGADGLHWPEKRLRRRMRSRHQGRWRLETAAAHGGRAIARALTAGVTIILVSPAFASDSPSAGRPLGPHRLAALAKAFPRARLIALAGVDATRARRLRGKGVKGLAMVGLRR